MFAWMMLQMEWWSAGACLALTGAGALGVRLMARRAPRARSVRGSVWTWTERERLARGVVMPSDRAGLAEWRVLM